MRHQKVLVLYNFDDEEGNVLAPNFYKECAIHIFPKNNLEVYFLPKYKNTFIYNFCLKLYISKGVSKRIRYALWYLFNVHKFDIIIGWIDLGILASIINYFTIFKKKKIFLILYYINEQKIKTNKYFALIYKIVSKGTFKLISLDTSQSNLFMRTLSRDHFNTINITYGVNSMWYTRYLNTEIVIEKKTIFCPGGAHRNDNILIKTFYNLNYTIRRFQMTSIGKSELDVKIIGNSFFEYYTNINYEEYINFCLRSEFVIISVDNIDKPVGLTSLLECMSLGKTIFISRGLSSNDYIIDNETGIIFDNEIDLVLKLSQLEKTPEKVKQIGLNAMRAARQIFGLEITGTNLVNIITRN
jgi:glycosyltransferase involved in cell wall biosynthesis